MATEISPLPSPFGKPGAKPSPQPEQGEGTKPVTFDYPFGTYAYDGPTAEDIPSVPKPLATSTPKNAETIVPPPVKVTPQELPKGGTASLEYLAQVARLIITRPTAFVTGNVTCAVAGRGYQLPPFLIPLFKEVAVKAWFTNVGVIYVAYRQSDSQNVAVGWPLIANEGVGYDIPKTDDVWVMAAVAGEGVSFTVEQA